MPLPKEVIAVKSLSPAGNYWEPPKPEITGDKTRVRIFNAVGTATTRWEGLEESMALLHAVFVEAPTQAATRVYAGFSAVPAKAMAITTASEIFFTLNKVPKDIREPLAIIIKHYRAASDRRNEIVHGVQVKFLVKSPNGCFLIPPSYNSKKVRAFITPNEMKSGSLAAARLHYRYTSNQINQLSEQFGVLRQIVTDYAFYLYNNHRMKGRHHVLGG